MQHSLIAVSGTPFLKVDILILKEHLGFYLTEAGRADAVC